MKRILKGILVFILLLPIVVRGQMIVTVVGGGTIGLGDGGLASLASLGGAVSGFAIDKYGSVIIADWWNNRVRKIDINTGIISTIAGTGVGGYNGDNMLATAALLFGPKFIAIDTFGNIFVSETQNQRVRKINTSGIITTYVGNGFGAGFTGNSHAFSGDTGPATAAELNSPNGLAIDKWGNLYISDNLNYRIRAVDDSTHIIKTVAGRGAGAYSGDNVSATTAYLVNVFDVYVDAYNDLYLPDLGDSSNRIRKVEIAPDFIHSVAGTGIALYMGDSVAGSAANMGPYSVARSPSGDLFIADYVNNRIRKIDAESGIITTIAGTGVAGFSGDYGPAKDAEIFEPTHLAFDSCGNLYFSDAQNLRIRKIIFDSTCHFGLTKTDNIKTDNGINLYPNPATHQLTVSYSGIIYHISICNLLGQELFNKDFETQKAFIEVGSLPKGVYFVKINNEVFGRFVKE